MLKDQRNNNILNKISLNINKDDILIPMSIKEDSITGPNSIYASFNQIDKSSTYMIPYKNIIFNNINSNYIVKNDEKYHVGLRHAYVIDNTVIDNTILVKI
jgi:hypothetical protein